MAVASAARNDEYHRVPINGNTAGGGQGQAGGIHVGSSGVVNITSGTIQNNTAGWGGGIDIDSGGSLTLNGTHVVGNTAAYQGGGMDNNGSLTVTGARIDENTAGGEGGGIIQMGLPRSATATSFSTRALGASVTGVVSRHQRSHSDPRRTGHAQHTPTIWCKVDVHAAIVALARHGAHGRLPGQPP